MKEILQDRLKAVGWRAGGTGLGITIQKCLEYSAKSEVGALAARLFELGNVGSTDVPYWQIIGESGFPPLVKVVEALDRISLPHHLDPWGWAAAGLLTAGSLLADWKNGDWISRAAEKLEENDRESLAKAVKFGGRLVQLSLSGAVALTPQIITKAMEYKLSGWETATALSGLAYVFISTLPVIIDGIKAGILVLEKRQRQ
jgi:hypothetical protein